jgi:hypothetical protein
MPRKQLLDWKHPLPPTHPDASVEGPAELDEGEWLPPPFPLPTLPPKNWRDEPKPPRVARMPCDHRGFPVLYTVRPRDFVDGTECDFRIINLTNYERCYTETLCGVCGEKVHGQLWFLGGPMCVQNRIFGDPAMHEECARYAMRVCPFLTKRDFGYHDRAGDEEKGLGRDDNLIKTKPERLVLYATADYLPIRPRGSGKLLCTVKHARFVEWYTPNGAFVRKTRPTRYAQ